MDVSVIKQESTQTVVNARAELGRAATWLEDFIASADLPDDLNSRLLVVLDEVLSNVVNHALAGAVEGAFAPPISLPHFRVARGRRRRGEFCRCRIFEFCTNAGLIWVEEVWRLSSWKTKPTWYMVATAGRSINPDQERMMAKRANAKTVEVNAGHVAYMSHFKETVQFVEEAATSAHVNQ